MAINIDKDKFIIKSKENIIRPQEVGESGDINKDSIENKNNEKVILKKSKYVLDMVNVEE